MDLSAARSREAVLGLARHALLLAGPATGAEVAPGAGALGWRRRQKPLLHGAIDDRQDLEPCRRVVVYRNGALAEAAGSRAVVQPAGGDGLAQALRDGHAVQHGLQHLCRRPQSV